MNNTKLKLILISTPIGYLGSGRGGGVELTISSLIKGLSKLGHKIILVAPDNSSLPEDCSNVEILLVKGRDQPSWQNQKSSSPIVIPNHGVLPQLLEKALQLGKSADAVLNFSYDWLPLWVTPQVNVDLFHLISMGGVSEVIQNLIKDFPKELQQRLAFHTYRQAFDYSLVDSPNVVGNGFDLSDYQFQKEVNGPLGWAGRIAPEKGLEDAAAVASALGDRLLVWGVRENMDYADSIEKSVPKGTIDWRGFLPTKEFQKQLGRCRAFLNTPKWNEAYGNVVVEAMACGVPVVAFDRGGPGEIIESGKTGWLVKPDEINEMILAASKINQINRNDCRKWVEENASKEIFASRILSWINSGLDLKKSLES